MKVVTCSSFNEAAQKTSDFLRSVIGNEQKSRLQIFLPTGRTPRPLYGLMTAAKDFWGFRLSKSMNLLTPNVSSTRSCAKTS